MEAFVWCLVTTMVIITTAEARNVRHHYRSSVTVFDPDRSRTVDDSQANVFETMQKSTPFPFASGTTILDAYSGRFPVTIGAHQCSDPITDWQQISLTLHGARLRR